MSFTISNKEYSSIESYRAESILRFSKEKEILLAPEVFSGLSIGRPVDFHLHESMGLKHPKTETYYRKLNPEPEFLDIWLGIKTSGALRDPIIAYAINDNLFVLDGATRLSAISYIKEESPDSFQRIPVRLFKGSLQDAQFEMIRRNMPDSTRPLRANELCQAIMRFRAAGIKPEEICINLHKPKTWEPIVYKYIKASENLIPELLCLMGTEGLSATAAFEASVLSEDKQKEVLVELLAGTKLRIKDIKDIGANPVSSSSLGSNSNGSVPTGLEDVPSNPKGNTLNASTEKSKKKVNVGEMLEETRMKIYALETCLVQEGHDLDDSGDTSVEIYHTLCFGIGKLDLEMQRSEARRLASVNLKPSSANK